MPSHYSNLLQMLGYDFSSISGLFSDFEDPSPRWAKDLLPAFKLAQEALGGLPGQRRGMLGQLRGGLQQRSVAAGRGLQGQRAVSGFAGSGAIDELGRISRQGLQQDFSRGSFRIGQDIQQREAGLLGVLSGKVSSYLQALQAGDTKPVIPGERFDQPPGDEEPIRPGAEGDYWRSADGALYTEQPLDFKAWLESVGESQKHTSAELEELQDVYDRYLGNLLVQPESDVE